MSELDHHAKISNACQRILPILTNEHSAGEAIEILTALVVGTATVLEKVNEEKHTKNEWVDIVLGHIKELSSRTTVVPIGLKHKPH